MSDGGAGAIVESVSVLAQFKVGRAVLWFVAAYAVVVGLSSRGRDWELFVLGGVVLALVALVAGFLAERKKRAERASLRAALLLWLFICASVVAGAFLLFRRKEALPPPPSEADVDGAAEAG
ncbi:MAG: hypothetical protein K1X89_18210 [Myxococcaceae bacterium]|nr:hypothetical protein [Myxococcaceae bacterium]